MPESSRTAWSTCEFKDSQGYIETAWKKQNSTKKRRHLKNPTPYHSESIETVGTGWALSRGDKGYRETPHTCVLNGIFSSLPKDKDVCSHNLNTVLEGLSHCNWAGKGNQETSAEGKE